MSTARGCSKKKRPSESEATKLNIIKQRVLVDDDDVFCPEFSNDIKGIMTALQQIKEKAQKDGQKKNEDTISRRVNQAIYLLTTGARESAFRNVKTIAECLVDELINAAKGSSNSYAIKKKDEIDISIDYNISGVADVSSTATNGTRTTSNRVRS